MMWKAKAMLSTLEHVVKLCKKVGVDSEELKKEIIKARIEVKEESLKLLGEINEKLNELERIVDEGNSTKQKSS